MLAKFLACGLAALALVRATPVDFQVNIAVSFDTAATAGVEPGNYYLVNVGTNQTLFGGARGNPVYMESTSGTPGTIAQWKIEPGATSNEYKFFNTGFNSYTSANNGHVYLSFGWKDMTLVFTPVQGKADTFVIITPGYGTWTAQWDTYYKQNQVFFAYKDRTGTPDNRGTPEQSWKFIRID